jgi:hypothetical protein
MDTGDGNDTITASSSNVGMRNSGVINTGSGNDSITASGGTSGIYGSSTVGISNSGTINTGNGNDTITGSGSPSGIYNISTINTGAGNDVVDALIGGFGGGGTTDLETGNDTLKGFGAGTFKGGLGSDTLVFNAGTYTIAAGVGAGNYVIGGIMNVPGFELFGPGANITSFSAAVAAGSVTFS